MRPVIDYMLRLLFPCCAFCAFCSLAFCVASSRLGGGGGGGGGRTHFGLWLISWAVTLISGLQLRCELATLQQKS